MVNDTNSTEPATPKAVFFDIRDTLGSVDRKGHLVKYKPSTGQLLDAMKQAVGLRIGLITNLPTDVSREDGFKMVQEVGIADYLDPQGFVTNHEAGAEKPAAGIYQFAAKQMDLDPSKCVFVGENLIEVIGAEAAGMRTVLKPFPPGREFLLKPTGRGQVSDTSSGRLSEILLEEDHLVAKRIVGAGFQLIDKISALTDPATQIQPLLRPMGMLVWLTKNFVDPFHHRKEEEVLYPFGLMSGLSPAEVHKTLREHDQGRTYFRGLEIAYKRILEKDPVAINEFLYLLKGFTELYKAHGARENDVLFKQLGDLITAEDDAVMVDLINRIGPADLTLYVNVIASMEKDLGA